jgi:2',3'-cyclic-nucleotide 2'-phosphodiesterase/3'-nucleotidase
LRRRTGETRFPWIASNLTDTATGARPTWLAPYQIIDTAGLRIAVLGYLAPETKLVQPAERTAGLRFGEGELALHEVLGEVRAARPALTVLLADAGAACDSVTCEGEVLRLAEQLGGSGVDLIVAGRSPRSFETRVAGIAIVGPGGPGAVAVADLVRTPAGGREVRVRVEPVAAGPPRTGSPVAGVLQSVNRLADSMERRVVARLKRPLDRAGSQFALGALLAEARRNAARADLGLVRNASIRSGLPAGAVTWAALRTVEPAGAALVQVTLTGTQLRELAERVVGDSGAPSAHLAGAEVRYDPRAARGRRTRRVELAGERKLGPQESYTLVTDDATAGGAGGLLPGGLAAVRLGLTDVEATAAYLRRLPQPVEPGPAVAFQSTRR